MPLTALALFAAYALLGFGLRTWLQLRATGDSGFRGISGRPGSAHWWAGVLFVVAIVAGVLGPIAALLGLEPLPGLTHPSIQTGGLVLAVVGIAATVLTQIAMGASWRVGVDESERTDLVTDGPFSIVRNPIFTAMAFTAAGLGLMVPNVVALAGAALLVVAVQVQVRVVEEPYLRRTHGALFAEYAARTGRFVPGVGRG